MKRLHTRESIVSGFRAHLRLRGMLLVIAAALMMGTLLAACGPAPVETQSTLDPTPIFRNPS